MRREVIAENKKTHKKEKALFKIIKKDLWFISNMDNFNGAPLDCDTKEGFKYSYVLTEPRRRLNDYKNFKEFAENSHLKCFFDDDDVAYKFIFADEIKHYFKEIKI